MEANFGGGYQIAMHVESLLVNNVAQSIDVRDGIAHNIQNLYAGGIVPLMLLPKIVPESLVATEEPKAGDAGAYYEQQISFRLFKHGPERMFNVANMPYYRWIVYYQSMNDSQNDCRIFGDQGRGMHLSLEAVSGSAPDEEETIQVTLTRLSADPAPYCQQANMIF